MAQQDNPGVRNLENETDEEFEEDLKNIDSFTLCKCCGLKAVSVIVSDYWMCLKCHSTVPEHIRKDQVLRFAIAFRKRRKDE
jgi:ribosomal protein L37AE/L43A